MDIEDFFNNKNIILTGPSSHVKDKKNGKFIDNFDLVVRVNWQWPIPEEMQEDLGVRMDILYHCSKNEPYARSFYSLFDEKDFYDVKMVYYIREQTNGKEFEYLLNKNNIPHKDLSLFCKHLKNTVCDQLNTGYIAIKHIILQNILKLYILGISFHKEKYYKDYCKISDNWYDASGKFISQGKPDILLNDFCEMYHKDKRIFVDKTLKEIIIKENNNRIFL
jgi:hypothetical protein